MDKMYEVSHPNQPTPVVGVGQPGGHPTQHSVQTDPTSVASTIAVAGVKYDYLLTMALSAKQDAEEDGLYLDTASDERISRLVQKIERFEIKRDAIQTSL